MIVSSHPMSLVASELRINPLICNKLGNPQNITKSDTYPYIHGFHENGYLEMGALTIFHCYHVLPLRKS